MEKQWPVLKDKMNDFTFVVSVPEVETDNTTEDAPFTKYVISIRSSAPMQNYMWRVSRRFSEFYGLHGQLREKHQDVVFDLSIPSRKPFRKLDAALVEKRRVALERYLQLLVARNMIVLSSDLRVFFRIEPVPLSSFISSSSSF